MLKNLPENIRLLIKRFFYRYQLTRLLSFLGLGGPLWRLYCRWFGPEDGVVQIEVLGKFAKFYVHNKSVVENLKSLTNEGHLLELLIQRLRPGDCVYDIGAEIGLYTLFLAQVVRENGEIIAFEPEDSCYERLQENLRLNSLNNVRLFRLALSDYSGKGKLYLGRVGTAPGLIDIPIKRNRSQIIQKVKIMEGDLFVKMAKLPQPQAVKIDVEGSEYSVIKGLQKTLNDKACQMVCCEVHPTLLPEGIKPEMVIELLKSYGFNRIDIYPRGETFHAFCSKD